MRKITGIIGCVLLIFLTEVLYSSNYASSNDTCLINLSLPYPHGITFDSDGFLYLTDHSDTNLYTLNATNGSIVTRIKLNTSAPRGITFENGNLWLATDFKLHKINPQNGDIEKSFSGFPKNQQGLVFFSNALWVSSIASNLITKIDYVNGSVLTSFPSPVRYPRGLCEDGTHLINIDSEEDTIYYINPQDGKILSSFLAYRGAARGIFFKDNRFFVVDKDKKKVVAFPVVKSEHYTLAAPYVQKISLKLKLQNSSSEPASNVVLRVALPTSSLQTEILRRAIFTNGYEIKPSEVCTDEYGEVTWQLQLRFAPDEVIDIQLDCIGRMWSYTANITTNKGNNYDIPKEIAALYTQDDELYQINDAYIAAASLLAQGNATNLYDRVKNVHNFLAERLVLQDNLTTNLSNAKIILQRGYGNALDYSVAFVALLRAASIPARIIAGAQPQNFDSGTFSNIHFWVEAYIPPYQWVPFDMAHNDTDNGYVLQREVGALEWSCAFKKELNASRLSGWQGFYKLQNASSIVVQAEMFWDNDLSLDGKTIVETGSPVCADFDGDNKADPAIFQNETGRWLALSSKDNYKQYSFVFLPEQIKTNAMFTPFAADFDGDGRADPAFYIGEKADWAAMLSSEKYRSIYLQQFLGANDEKLAVSDFDGDSKADPATFSPDTGALNIKFSSMNYTLRSFDTHITGAKEKIHIMPADYDGDQKIDIVILNELTQKLVMFLSSNNYVRQDIACSSLKEPFIAADCDGDRRADVVVYDKNSGIWKIRLAAQNFEVEYSFKLDFYIPAE